MVKPQDKNTDLISEIKNRWDDLIDKGQVVNLHKGQYLFYENHNALGAYLLCKGTILLTKGHDPLYKRELSAESKPILGMDYLLTGDTYCFSAIATSDAELCYLSKSEILKLLP